MIEVCLLGTGTPNPDPARCGSGTSIETADGWILVDCGRGVCQRIAEAHLELGRLEAVFLTHHHSDHVSDLAGLAIMRWVDGAAGPLVVVAPAGRCSEFARRCLDAYDDQAFHGQADATAGPRPTIEVRSFDPLDESTQVYASGRYRVSSALVDHYPIDAAVGYRILVESKTIVISGDTAVCAGIESLASDAHLLIHEGLRGSAVSAALLEWNASAETVGAMAHRANVDHVVLTHMLPAPADVAEEAEYVSDVRAGGYEGTVSIARDLMRLALDGAID